MTPPLVLTFAELEFVLRSRPDRAAPVREALRLNPDASSDVVAAAGVSSLLARELCTLSGTDVVPGSVIGSVTAGLSTWDTYTEAVGWVGERMVLAHVFSGPAVRVALYPAAYGQFSVEVADPGEALSVPVTRFLDACTGGEGEAAVAVRSGTGDGSVSIAVARDGSGGWYVSDTLESPDRGLPTTREGVVRRLGELLDARPVGTHG